MIKTLLLFVVMITLCVMAMVLSVSDIPEHSIKWSWVAITVLGILAICLAVKLDRG